MCLFLDTRILVSFCGDKTNERLNVQADWWYKPLIMKVHNPLRLYIVSILGVTRLPAPGEPDKEMVAHAHYADLIEAQSIEIAGEMVCERLKAEMPQKDWELVDVVVDPVSTAFIRQSLAFHQQGFLVGDEPSEKRIEVRCSGSRADQYGRILFALDKPPS